MMAGFRAPRITMRTLAVWRRNFLVWKKLAGASILGNIADPLITLAAFGYGLGSMIGTVQGAPYILFLASGSIAMSTMNAATFEALYSAYSRMGQQKTWDAIMHAPVSLDDIVFGELLWAITKSMFTATAILMVVLMLGISNAATLVFVLPLLALVGGVFASLGLIMTALSRGYEFFTYYFTLLITPMMFLSGVFFPLTQLPVWLQGIAAWLPLGLAVQLVRPLFFGQMDPNLSIHLAALLAWAIGAFLIALQLFRRRFSM